ncbi:MAG: pteridine-dependent deoxygenase [Rhodanobacter sp. 68-29]|uniref:chorismate transformation enzyme, FkbO/Hyg5 family n=1 Tax=Rhodanobacter sp. PCA2 TaxID=2006117 RepID=UPI00086A57DE|nr:pteridine-dependent deoxygenase [Rhodanobacter sp. PCA2]MBA2080043.1 pteridine-dependent deoxygenase [Rhodanobacter sp. PCA2]MBN8924852.1 pteridine-dependent deoxygenase [Rhodanobacter sp.]ODU73255.1 MAG: pteridine-dependent deoxygenase [Rhodanobacter sp. SCN 69-32]OJY57496.1 MAG: pteridine-dependent deoxygenase [Rhodanobacter sp. 68-29]
MTEGCESRWVEPGPARAPRISYRLNDAAALLAEPGTLAVFGFGHAASDPDDPRWLRVPLEALDAPAPLEAWQVDDAVQHGRDGALRWSAGGGWLFAAVELDEREHGGPAGAAREAYAQLRDFIRGRAEHRVLRIWNYQAAINAGHGDAERYKLFCDGRAEGCGDWFADGYPAATAIGHHGDPHLLQIYLLAGPHAGTAVENPRQVSAWRYPRQYGRTSPGFARAMTLPAGDALAISGTAAVVGHASAHEGDLAAQLQEILVNLEALLASAGMPAGFDTHAPLKAYVRHPADAPRVRELLQQRLPGVPVLLLQGDVCRSELLVELDGWRYA